MRGGRVFGTYAAVYCGGRVFRLLLIGCLCSVITTALHKDSGQHINNKRNVDAASSTNTTVISLKYWLVLLVLLQ